MAAFGLTAGLPMSYKLGPRWNAVITRPDFKSEAIFGFLSPNYTSAFVGGIATRAATRHQFKVNTFKYNLNMSMKLSIKNKLLY